MTTQEEVYLFEQLSKQFPQPENDDEEYSQWKEWKNTLYSRALAFANLVDEPMDWVLEEQIESITFHRTWQWRRKA